MSKGYSLIELLYSLCILSVLLILCISGMHSMNEKQHADLAVKRLFHLLQYARNEAITRQQSVNICGSHDMQECSADWSNGYIIFIADKSPNMPRQVLYQVNNKPGLSIHSGAKKFFRFYPDGRSHTNGTIKFSDPQQSKIVILNSGRCRIEHKTAL